MRSIFLIFAAFFSANTLRAAPSAPWFGDNAQRLQGFIRSYGKKGAHYDAVHKPVAAFDWDNTMIKNDIGDATLYWMVANEKFKMPKDWKTLSPYLEPRAAEELAKNCATSNAFLPSRSRPACADTLLAVYDAETMLDGKTPAWKSPEKPDEFKPSYGFYAQLFQGYTPEEVRGFTEETLAFNLKNPLDAKQKLGTKQYNAYVRLYPQMKGLIHDLQEAGFDVWIISASLQPSVEAMARLAGVAADHVIGIRPALDAQGRYTDAFEGCGPYPEGNKRIISYRQGKRCWLNKVIFKVKDPVAMLTQAAPLAFAAGDTENDFFSLQDARGLRLVINRNKPELLCNAYRNSDGKWLINPMFIRPMGKKAGGFQCGSFGLPDQEDKVYGFYP